MFTAIYNGYRITIQKHLWRELSGMSHTNTPWILMGDFNTIASPTEHKGGLFQYYANKVHLFSDFILNSSLLDVGFMLKLLLIIPPCFWLQII